MEYEDLTPFFRKNVDFFLDLSEYLKGNYFKSSKMIKNLIKAIVTLTLTSSAFFIGFYLGQEKIVSRIPNFQEDSEEKEPS